MADFRESDSWEPREYGPAVWIDYAEIVTVREWRRSDTSPAVLLVTLNDGDEMWCLGMDLESYVAARLAERATRPPKRLWFSGGPDGAALQAELEAKLDAVWTAERILGGQDGPAGGTS